MRIEQRVMLGIKIGAFVLLSLLFAAILGTYRATRDLPKIAAQSNVTPGSMSIPNCPDSGGNHLNWSSGTMVCGLSAPRTVLTCTTGGIGGSLILINNTISGTCTVSGAVTGTPCLASSSDGTVMIGVGIEVDCKVSSANTATVTLYALVAATPPSKTYNVTIP